MLSSTHLKKIRSFIAFTLFASVFLHLEANALSKVVFVDDKSNEIEMNIDHTGNVHLVNTPVAGDFYYKKSSEEFIFRLEGMEQFYRLPISKLKPEKASLSKVKSQDRRITDTQVWDISSKGNICGIVKSSKSMVKDLKLTLGDMVSINNAFAYILGEDLRKNPCLNYIITKAVAEEVGFPIYLSTNHGTTLLREERLLEYGRRVLLPKGAILATDEEMQDIYLHQLPEAARDLYMSVGNGRSSNPKMRLSAIRKSMAMVKSGEWKPKEEVQKSFKEEMEELSRAATQTPIVTPDKRESPKTGFGGISN